MYADIDDLTNPPDENPEQWLLLASRLVDEAVVTAIYPISPDGLPAGEELRDLFKAATVAQVEHWQALDIDPTHGAAGVTGKRLASSKSIGSASVAYESGEQATRSRLEALSTLAPAALAILGSLPRSGVIVHG